MKTKALNFPEACQRHRLRPTTAPNTDSSECSFAPHVRQHKSCFANEKALRPVGQRACFESESGRHDLNVRPPAPKAGALAKLSYAPSVVRSLGTSGYPVNPTAIMPRWMAIQTRVPARRFTVSRETVASPGRFALGGRGCELINDGSKLPLHDGVRLLRGDHSNGTQSVPCEKIRRRAPDPGLVGRCEPPVVNLTNAEHLLLAWGRRFTFPALPARAGVWSFLW